MGAIIAHAGADVPEGWLVADGRELPRTDHPELFAIIGNTYGGSPFLDTFKLPDLRQRLPMGEFPNDSRRRLGVSGGAWNHTHNSPPHNHAISSAAGHAHDVPAHTHRMPLPATRNLNGDIVAIPPPEMLNFSAGAQVRSTSPANGPLVDDYELASRTVNQFLIQVSQSTGTLGNAPAHNHTGATTDVAITVQAANPAVIALQYLIKAHRNADTPCAAVYATAASNAVPRTLPADGTDVRAAGYTTLAGCLHATFSGLLPDVRGRFIIGPAAAGVASRVGYTAGQMEHTHGTAPHVHGIPAESGHSHSGASHTHAWGSPVGVYGNEVVLLDPVAGDVLNPALVHTAASGTLTVGEPSPRVQNTGAVERFVVITSGSTVTTANDQGHNHGGSTAPMTLGTDEANPPYLALNHLVPTEAAYQLASGTVVPFAGPEVPEGWLLADGREVSRGTHAALFEAIGTRYGDGDGLLTFNLPDLRGASVVGAELLHRLGSRGGSFDHTHALPAHAHAITTEPDHVHTLQPHTHASISPIGRDGNRLTLLHPQDFPLTLPGSYTYAGTVLAPWVRDAFGSVMNRSSERFVIETEPPLAQLESTADGQHDHGGATAVATPTLERANAPYLAVQFIIKQ